MLPTRTRGSVASRRLSPISVDWIILINNAGVGAIGPFDSADPERVRRIMEVNFFALVEMTRLALPHLKQGRTPIIVNISSILGRRGVPHNSEYTASKFAVHGFSESIRAEFAGSGVDVLVVSPGTTETEFFDNVLESKGGPKWPEHAAVPPKPLPEPPSAPSAAAATRSRRIFGARCSYC